MPDLITYEPWNCDVKDGFPKRTYLYHLQPIGVGSAHVESLTGYIARLAEAHAVSCSVFLRELLSRLPQESDDPLAHPTASREYGFIYDAHVLNGLASCPHNWVRLLETLTGQKALHTLTMLTWSRVISEIHLLRNNRAWCPYCFEAWRKDVLPIYEPLIWAIACVTICPFHRRHLETRCPECNRGSPLLTAKAWPGHCYRCRAWLGRPAPAGEPADQDACMNVASAVGELLTLAPGLPEHPSGWHFKNNLRRAVHEFAAGNHSDFARRSGISLDSVYHWLHIDSCARLVSVLRMCTNLRLSAARFISEHIPGNDPDWERTRQFAMQPSRLKVRRCSSTYREYVQQRAKNKETRRQRRDSVRDFLERVLHEPMPGSLQTIARDVGYRTSTPLRLWFPDLCHAILRKNRECRRQKDEWIREALTRALEENPPPTLRQMADRLGHSVTALRRRLPACTAALATRIPERHHFEKERMRQQLQSALELNPAPSMKYVGSLVGRDDNYLRTIFPELCQQITDRYFEQKRKASAQRRLQFCAQIRGAVDDLCQRGINPSRKHVFAAITNPSMRSSHILSQQIAETLHELEIASRQQGAVPTATSAVTQL